jgi:hypothetical protein
MTIPYVEPHELAEGAVIFTGRFNQLVRDVTALANRGRAQAHRGAATLGTTMGGWAELFTSDLSMTPQVGVNAMALAVILLNASTRDQWTHNFFRLTVNGAPDVSQSVGVWVQHGPVSGTNVLFVQWPVATLVAPLVLSDGANAINIEYQTANHASANFTIIHARLLVLEV